MTIQGEIIMSDDINNTIKQLADMLGAENMPENLSGILSMLSSSMSKDTPKNTPKPEPTPEENTYKEKVSNPVKDSVNPKDLMDNMEMVRKVKTIMDGLHTANDPRINLLTAISPFLNNSRQKKIGNCIKLFQMSRVTKLLSENEKLF